ncbi:MAG: DUF1905 domain-containing protein [Actinobacteria bacterium]|nr:MAG: DUF1905 domain-containing protein [Actinomycetota bacterium]
MYELTGEVWLSPGKGGWHFVTLPAQLVDELRVRYADAHRAFGSLRVRCSSASRHMTSSALRRPPRTRPPARSA